MANFSLTLLNWRSHIAACGVVNPREPIRRHRVTGNRSLTNGGSIMFKSARKTLSFAAALVSIAALVGTASAEDTWQRNHPRRTQVNQRLANQNKRINTDVKDGT